MNQLPQQTAFVPFENMINNFCNFHLQIPSPYRTLMFRPKQR